MNAVAKIDALPPSNVIGASSMMEVIGRAAADPNTDVEKLERLMAMAERIQARDAKTAYFAALAQLSDELPEIQQNCPECNGKTFIHMVGEEWPCPCCQSDAYEEQKRERRMDDGQFGVGA